MREANDMWPLLMAISNNNMAMAAFLLEQDDVVINSQDWYGRSPIWEAVNVRNLYVHNGTYENGIDRAPVLEFIKLLLDKGADPNVRTKETPPVRSFLLEITGTLEWVDFTGQTPFLAAAYAGDVTVMKLRDSVVERMSVNCQLKFQRQFLNALIERLEHANEHLAGTPTPG